LKKRFAAITGILAVIVCLSACKDELIYVDPADNEYIAVTDESHNTVLNEEGDVVVYQTEENGEIVTDESGVPQTQAVYFPNQIVDGDYVQTPTYTLTLPSGWKLNEDEVGKFINKSADATLEISIVDGYTFDEYYDYTISILNQMKEAAQDNASFSSEEDTFFYYSVDKDVNRFTISMTNSDGESVKEVVIIFEDAENIYKITCQATEDNFEKADFASLYSAINYKNYKYYD